MAAPAESLTINPDLEELRILTEVNNILAAMRPDGSVPEETLQDEQTNLKTAVQELVMPSAVATTIHRVEQRYDEQLNRQKNVITWLGKSAVESALGGKLFHFSEAAHQRVDIEIAEAEHAEESIAAGKAQVFISPRMSKTDAPEHIAKAEHLHDDDSVRVSYAVTNNKGEVIARRLQSLLVADIPLQAWVCMLKDPGNIFGRSFDLRNEESALSIMEIFTELELPEDQIPEGPVTLVEAVLPYVFDVQKHDSVTRQLDEFRKDQQRYELEAQKAAAEWLTFEVELAKSIHLREATFAVEAMISSLQHQWDDDDIMLISMHQLEAGGYAMTTQLATVLERAKRNLISSKAAFMTGNKKVLDQVDSRTAQTITDRIQMIGVMQAGGYSPAEIAREQAQLDRMLAGQNIQVERGCAGNASGKFKNNDPDLLQGSKGDNQEAQEASWDNKLSRKWKLGTCRVKSCPKPSPTEVGPCDVCKHCQDQFDAGNDPTASAPAAKHESSEAATLSPIDALIKELSEKFVRITVETPPADMENTITDTIHRKQLVSV